MGKMLGFIFTFIIIATSVANIFAFSFNAASHEYLLAQGSGNLNDLSHQKYGQKTQTVGITMMSDNTGGLRERAKRRRRGVQVLDRQKEDVKEKEKEKEALDKDKQWRVILHNDMIHTFDYVTVTLCETCTDLTRAAAHEICLVAHNYGEATVDIVWKKRAEEICFSLQSSGLTVSINPEKEFKSGGQGGGSS